MTNRPIDIEGDADWLHGTKPCYTAGVTLADREVTSLDEVNQVIRDIGLEGWTADLAADGSILVYPTEADAREIDSMLSEFGIYEIFARHDNTTTLVIERP